MKRAKVRVRQRQPCQAAMLHDDAPHGHTRAPPLQTLYVPLLLVVSLLTQHVGIVAGVMCPPKCACSEDTMSATCDRANLQDVPHLLNPRIRQVTVRNDDIEMLRTISLSFYRDLEYLDLTRNNLVAVEPTGFKMQTNLKVLKLSHNQISHIVNTTFLGLHNLKVLRLEDNNLERLTDHMFVHLKSLEELDLSLNQILNVSPAAFAGLTSLRTLWLRDNKLSAVPALSWAPLRHLSYLNLGSNAFMTILPEAFHSLESLQELMLDSCSIRDLTPDAFAGLVHLRTLRLRDNMLTTVPTHAWRPIRRLEELFLGQNYFDEIRAQAFEGLRRLRFLDVSGAQRLIVLRSGAFTNNTDLRKVVFNHNLHFAVVEVGAFQGLSTLRHLSLREDAFRTFSEDLLSWDELESVDLRDNPLECNCSLLWIRNLLNYRNLTLEPSGGGGGAGPVDALVPMPLASTAIRCHTPSSLRGRLLAELSRSDLGCNFPNARQQALFGIIGAATIACLATLILVVYKYRRRVTSVLKDKWTDGALRHKDLHYEKTNDEEENNILQVAQQSLKMTPVTEL